jgi:hypothetical protein
MRSAINKSVTRLKDYETAMDPKDWGATQYSYVAAMQPYILSQTPDLSDLDNDIMLTYPEDILPAEREAE